MLRVRIEGRGAGCAITGPRVLAMAELAKPAAETVLAPGGRLLVEAGTGPIALFEVSGTVRAIADGCLRCGASLLTAAQRGAVVTCGTCGWQYDIGRGCVVSLPALRLPTFDVRASRVE